MPTHRYAPPLAEVRDPAAPDAAEREASAVSGRLIGDLGLVVENAMARFDAIPEAKASDRGGGLSSGAQRDRAGLSANKVLRYAGFAELAQAHPDVAAHIARLQDLIAQALAPTSPAG